uniref:Decapping nuclease n=1 Tax=Tetranychus urticae TaxID=32264 RepID=T1KE46_TETUR
MGIRKDCYDFYFLPNKSGVKFVGPKRIGYFSSYYDKESEEVYVADNSAQRYLDSNELNQPINCLEGFNIETDEVLLPSSWSHFFRWVAENRTIIDGLSSNSKDSPLDFLCSNMELKKIMLSTYDKRGWLIRAVKKRNAIFLFLGKKGNTEEMKSKPEDQEKDELVNDKEDKEEEATLDCSQQKASKLNYARFNIIRKITKAVKERETNSNTVMDALSTVSFSKIGKHRILHTGFTEFVMSKDDLDKPIDQANFSALKLMQNLYKEPNGEFNIPFYRHLYWWASALLCGVKTLICGDLDEDFTLRKLDVLPASKLNKDTLDKQRRCFITLDKTLDFIKSHVKESDKMYEFTYEAAPQEIIVTEKSLELQGDGDLPWYFTCDI